MAFPLSSLPEEVVRSYLLPLLRPGDIIFLSRYLDFEITDAVYHLAFPHDPKFDHYGRRMFENRCKANLFFIGGLSPSSEMDTLPPNYEWAQKGCGRMHTPLKMDSRDCVILKADLRSGHRQETILRRSVDFLDSKGKLHFLLEDEQYGENAELLSQSQHSNAQFHLVDAQTWQNVPDNYASGRLNNTPGDDLELRLTKAGVAAGKAVVEARQNVSDMEAILRAVKAKRAFRDIYRMTRQDGHDAESDAEYLEMEDEYDRKALDDPETYQVYEQPYGWNFADSAELHEASQAFCKESRFASFTDFASGDSVWAVDESGMLWGWRYLSNSETQGVPFFVQDDITGDLHPVGVGKKLYSASWAKRYVVEGRVIVQSLGTCAPTFMHANGWMAGVPCFDDHFCTIGARTIGATDTVKDFVSLPDFHEVWLHRGGTLDVSNWLGDSFENRAVNSYGPFIQLAGSQWPIIALTSHGKVVEVSSQEDEGFVQTVRPVEALADIVSVAAGDGHFLALSAQGDVYSWGYEQGFNGCLGLGHFLEAVKMDGVTVTEDRLILDTPTKIKLPGKAYGIWAKENMSLVLVGDSV